MIKVNNIVEFNPKMTDVKYTLETISKYINLLIAKEGRDKIVEKSGIDKNILYRLSTGGNTNLDKYLKIRNAFPTAFKDKVESSLLSDCPILGQIIEDHKVRLLNVSQPTSFKVLSNTAKQFSPLFGYLNVSATAYTNSVHLFSTSNLNSDILNKQCINRIIMAYPEDNNPIYCLAMSDQKGYQLVEPLTRKVIMTVPIKNNVKWAKWISLTSFSLAENIKPDENNEHDHLVNEQYIKDVQSIGTQLREMLDKK